MELNSKNYVNLELAIKLKEIGYNIPCNSYYRKDYNNSETFKGYYSCPLLYDVQSWFREIHNIHVYTVICDSIKCYNIDKNGTEIVNGVSIHDDGTGIRIPGVLYSPLTDEEIEKDLAWVYEKMDKNGILC